MVSSASMASCPSWAATTVYPFRVSASCMEFAEIVFVLDEQHRITIVVTLLLRWRCRCHAGKRDPERRSFRSARLDLELATMTAHNLM